MWTALRNIIFLEICAAGHKKIANLFYHDGSEFAKRNKCFSWRVAVEMSENVAQLIYQVESDFFHTNGLRAHNSFGETFVIVLAWDILSGKRFGLKHKMGRNFKHSPTSSVHKRV